MDVVYKDLAHGCRLWWKKQLKSEPNTRLTFKTLISSLLDPHSNFKFLFIR